MKEKPLHEKKISELGNRPICIGIWLLARCGHERCKVLKDLKQWAIAVVKENRKQIHEIIKEHERMGSVFEDTDKEATEKRDDLNWEKGQLARINEFLIDRFEITKEDLK